MDEFSPDFFITGGTLPADALSYVERRADEELFTTLSRGEFCYVLTSRQMGKSSLMVRTAARLREIDTRVAVVDLTAIGRNVTPEQWYRGILALIGQQVGLEDEMDACWRSLEGFSPVQRLVEVIRRICLAAGARPLVVFLDEIDAVRSLPFSGDEFLAAVRECHNRRSHEPDFHRLTFCLLGVALPADLIRDPRSTPFNVSRRIELDDFTAHEARVLALGIALGGPGVPSRSPAQARRLLGRAFYWTGGHPYLTQRLCRAIAAETGAWPPLVDRLCRGLFLAPGPRQRDDNLAFVRDRLLGQRPDAGSGDERSAQIELYARVRRGDRVPDDPASRTANLLRLSGVVRPENGRLRVRNRVYAAVFNRQWAAAHTGGAALRRQQAAYRRGLFRAATLVGALALAGLFGYGTYHQAEAGRVAARQGRRSQYVADLQLAQRALDQGELRTAVDLLATQAPNGGQEDLRGFEWRYLWGLTHRELGVLTRTEMRTVAAAFPSRGSALTLAEDDGNVSYFNLRQGIAVKSEGLYPAGERWRAPAFYSQPALSREGGLVVQASAPEAGAGVPTRGWKLWLVRRGQRSERLAIPVGDGPITSVAASEARGLVASARPAPGRAGGVEIALWSARTGRRVGVMTGRGSSPARLQFSASGDLLMGDTGPRVQLWSVPQRRALRAFAAVGGGRARASLSADGRMVAVGSRMSGDERRSVVRIYHAGDGKAAGSLELEGAVACLVLSPDTKLVAVGTESGVLTVARWRDHRVLSRLPAHSGAVSALAFAPSGGLILTSGDDCLIKLWKASDDTELRVVAHRTGLESVRFTEDATTLATADAAGDIGIWDAAAGRRLASFAGDPRAGIVFPPGGRGIVLCRNGSVWRRDLNDPEVVRVAEYPHPISAMLMAPGDSLLVASRSDPDVRVWDTRGARDRLRLPQPDGVSSLALSGDGRMLVLRGVRGGVAVWDLPRRAPLSRFPTVYSGPVAVTHRGEYLAWADGNAIFLHERVTRRTQRLVGHVRGVAELAFSPDGRTLASIGQDDFIGLWNVACGRQVLALPGARQGGRALSFARDGSALAAGLGDGSVRIWRASPRDPAASEFARDPTGR